MSDIEVRDTDPEDPDEVEAEEVDGVEETPRAVYPVADGNGGTKYVYGATDEEASYEEWAAQNGVAVPTTDDENLEDPDDPELRDQRAIEE